MKEFNSLILSLTAMICVSMLTGYAFEISNNVKLWYPAVIFIGALAGVVIHFTTKNGKGG